MAFTTRVDFAASLSLSIRPSPFGTICHDSPNLLVHGFFGLRLEPQKWGNCRHHWLPSMCGEAFRRAGE